MDRSKAEGMGAGRRGDAGGDGSTYHSASLSSTNDLEVEGDSKASCELPQDGSTAGAGQGRRIGRERRRPMPAERCGGAPLMRELSTDAS